MEQKTMEVEKLQIAVFHLKKYLTSGDLERVFSTIGPVWNVHVIPDKRNRRFNYGFVTMRKADAYDAVYFRRIRIEGERVFVKLSTGEPSEHSRFIERLRKEGKLSNLPRA